MFICKTCIRLFVVLKMTNDVMIRMHKDTKYIFDRYAKLHFLRTMHLLDKIALVIKCGLDGIDDPNWTIDDLRKYYSNSDLVCVQDVRTIFEPVKETKENE